MPGILSPWVSESHLLFFPVLMIPLREEQVRPEHFRGLGGESGGGQTGNWRGVDGGSSFQLWLRLLFAPLSLVGEGEDTPAGFLSGTAETFMKSLQRQGGRDYFYLLIDSAAVAALCL